MYGNIISDVFDDLLVVYADHETMKRRPKRRMNLA